MKIEFQDRIDEYLLDRMSDEERKSFESDAAEDAELKEQLQFTETVQQATKSRNEKLAAMEEWKDDYVWEDKEWLLHLPLSTARLVADITIVLHQQWKSRTQCLVHLADGYSIGFLA